MEPGKQFDAFVLVHPESIPSVHHDVDDASYAKSVRSASRGAKKVAILDMYTAEDHRDGASPVGVSRGWRTVTAEPGELDDERVGQSLQAHLGNAKNVGVGGYHRDDCVPRVVQHLTRLGYRAVPHEPSLLPPRGRQ